MTTEHCAAGTVLRRSSPYKGLNWTVPCERVVEHDLPFNPPMYFCDAHYQVVADDLLSSPAMAEFVQRVGYVVAW